MLKYKNIGFYIVLFILIYCVISTAERIYWFNTECSSQGAIRKSLISDIGFGPEINGMVFFKINKGKIYYKWSIFDQYDCGMWPFVKYKESSIIPDIIQKNILMSADKTMERYKDE